jgi:catechol 2,3-dioxygenase-like lactoylglutathione lyase family enzyme
LASAVRQGRQLDGDLLAGVRYGGKLRAAPMLKKITMVSIRVKDWKAAVDWYSSKLDLKPAGLHDDPWCVMLLPEGDTVIALDGTNAPLGSSNCIPNVLVDDLDGTVSRLKDRGVTFEREIIGDSEEGYRIATIRDLEGNLINLYEDTRGRA